MNKLNFRTVSLDLNTYDQLSILASAARLSRAEYIRHLIRAQIPGGEPQKSPNVNEPMTVGAKYADMLAQGIKPVVRHDEVIPWSELPKHLQAITELANYFGVTIDRRKWQKYAADSLASLVDFIRVEGKPSQEQESI